MSRPTTAIQLTRLPPVRRALVEELATEFLRNYGHGRTALAIDGCSGTGKTILGDDLAIALRDRGATVFRASLDDFHFPRERRYREGRYSPRGYYRDSFDYVTLRRVLLEPFRAAGSAGFVLRAFDLARDAPIETDWVTAGEDAVLVVDGVFANRPELRGVWNWSVYLEAPREVARARASERAGIADGPDSPDWRRYDGAWELYETESAPRAAASVIVDTLEVDAPVRVYADSC